MSGLECPDCSAQATGGYRGARAELRKQVELVSEVWEADIEVLRCPQCDGIWLSDGQLEQIKQTRARDHGAVDPLAAAHARAYQAAKAAGSERPTIACLSCHEPMLATEHKRSHVTIDLCLECGGIWLTAEALSQIEIYAETMGG